MEDLSDEQIINLVLSGDRNRYAELIKRYNDRIYSIGMRLFRNADDAVDFSQEVFIRAYDKLHTFKFLSPFSHWLVRLAYNYGINILKIRRDCFDIENLNIASDDDYTEDVDKTEISKVLNDAIRELSPEYQLSIDLFFFWQMKLSDISALMGIPLNTVKSNVRRAKMMLYDKLKGTIAEEYYEMR